MIINAVRQLYPQDVEKWQSLYGGGQPSLADNLCGEAIAGFSAFSKRYLSFFDQLIQNGEFDPLRTTSDRLRAQSYQVFNDYWAPLGEVAAQRQVKPYRDLLDQATNQAQAYLDTLNLGLPGALIYFNKVTSIKYYPYTNIAFVGTPYTQVIFEDWMAIPHELGHYLYWNVGSSLAEVRKRHEELKAGAVAVLKGVLELQKISPDERLVAQTMVLSWLEETFCDVVGTRLGEVGFKESLQGLIRSSDSGSGDLVADDGHHAPLCIRIFIREHAHKLNGGGSRLDWEGFLGQALHVTDLYSLEVTASPPDLGAAMKALSAEALLTLLSAADPAKQVALPAVRFSVAQIVPAIEALVAFLNTEIDSLLKTGLPLARDPASTFDQLLELAQEDAQRTNKVVEVGQPDTTESAMTAPYEILLRPRVMEGGDQHGPHGAWAHFQYHEVGVHNH